MKLKPIGSRIVIRMVESKQPEGIIVIPDAAREKSSEGIVVELGKRATPEGLELPMDIKVDDRVLVSQYGGTDVKIDGELYKVLDYDQVICVLG